MKTSLGIWACGNMATGFNAAAYEYTRDQGVTIFLEHIAARIDDTALRAAQQRNDAVAAYELVYAALGA